MDRVGPPNSLNSLMDKYPGRVPVIALRSKTSSDIPELKKARFLVPTTMNMGQLLYVIRRQLDMPPEKALFVFINGTLPTTQTTISELYAQYKSEDGALRLHYTSEAVFG